MDVQIISNYKMKDLQDSEIQVNALNAPDSLDAYDLNIIDLTDKNIWKNNADSFSRINCMNDFKSLQTMITKSNKTRIIYMLPKNISYQYYSNDGVNYYNAKPLKDILTSVSDDILSNIIPKQYSNIRLVYEHTKTTLKNKKYEADFYFDTSDQNAMTKSDKSEKITTMKIDDNIFITSLDIFSSKDNFMSFITMFFPQNKSDVPEWMGEVRFLDDEEQQNIIRENELIIVSANENIEAAQCKLQDNMRYKSILYTNGNELVEVVFDILEQLLDVDLSEFLDEKKEDFLLKKDDVTFIGEIKGVTSNVKSEHVSQIDVHYYGYLDKLQEENKEEKVKQILIMNPLRNKKVSEREEVHENQINLAKRNGCLIIETVTLLRIFEKLNNSEITSAKCIEVFKEKTGLLAISDFN